MLEIRFPFQSAEVSKSIKQVGDALTAEFDFAGCPPLSRIDMVSIGLAHSISNLTREPRKPSGSYDKDSNSFFAQATVDYSRWVTGSWADWIASTEDAALAALRAVHKTRINDAERAMLAEIIRAAAAKATRTPPVQLAAIGKLYITRDSSGIVTSMGTTASPEAEAMDALAALALYQAAEFNQEPEMQSLYRKDGRAIFYHQAWVNGDIVIENRGQGGERGEVRTYPAASLSDRRRIMAGIAAEARQAGFAAIPPSRMQQLVLSAPMTDNVAADLDHRHALEDLLNNELGWLGLGYCDGGEIGSGSMEVFCRVVNRRFAVEAVMPILQANGFSRFTPVPNEKEHS
jgi:hypothetical protein